MTHALVVNVVAKHYYDINISSDEAAKNVLGGGEERRTDSGEQLSPCCYSIAPKILGK